MKNDALEKRIKELKLVRNLNFGSIWGCAACAGYDFAVAIAKDNPFCLGIGILMVGYTVRHTFNTTNCNVEINNLKQKIKK